MDGSVTVREVMDRDFVGVSESDTVRGTAEVLLSTGADGAVVLRGDDVLGVVTERDALTGLVERDGDSPVTAVMTEDVPTVSPEATVDEVTDQMTSQATKRVVVADESRPVGLLSEHDLVSASPFAAEPDVTADPELAVVGRSADRPETDAGADRGFREQSICEACGTFSRDLTQFNGQLLCGDCRDI